MYCFILLFNLFISLTTNFTVTGSGTLILCSVELTMLERFSAVLAIYIMLYSILKMRKYDFFDKSLKNHCFFPTLVFVWLCYLTIIFSVN